MEFFTDQDLFVKIDKGSARLRDTIKTFRNKYDYILIVLQIRYF
jgi:hypothetical protein